MLGRARLGMQRPVAPTGCDEPRDAQRSPAGAASIRQPRRLPRRRSVVHLDRAFRATLGRSRPACRCPFPRDRSPAAYWGAAEASNFPLIVFAPGYRQCGASYSVLLRQWASAGYVVAAVNFPRTNCHAASPDESDLVNQPGDLAFVIRQLDRLSGQPARAARRADQRVSGRRGRALGRRRHCRGNGGHELLPVIRGCAQRSC